jgi:hypothetical protein
MARSLWSKALSDHTYYPMQFEVIEQSVGDWDTDDKSTMTIQISAIPINYDLVVRGDRKYEYVRGFSYPLIGDEVFILNAQTVGDMYNKKVLDKVQWHMKSHTSLSSEAAVVSDVSHCYQIWVDMLLKTGAISDELFSFSLQQ